MKKLMIGCTALFFAFAVTSCGDSAPNAGVEQLEGLLGELESTLDDLPVVKPDAMVVSTEMTAFCAMLDGTSDGSTAALAAYGANDAVIDDDMGMYNLKDPKVMSQDGDCYRLDCISGAVTNTYTLCWADGKIVSVKEIL